MKKNSGTNVVALTPTSMGSAIIAVHGASAAADGTSAVTSSGDGGAMIYNAAGEGVAIAHDQITAPAGGFTQSVGATNAIRGAQLLDLPGGLPTTTLSPQSPAPSGLPLPGTSPMTGLPPGTPTPALAQNDYRWVSLLDPGVTEFIRNQLLMPKVVQSNLDGSVFPTIKLPFTVTKPVPAPAPPASAEAAPAPSSPAPAPQAPAAAAKDSGERWQDPNKSGVSFPYCSSKSFESKDYPGWGFENNASCRIK